MQRGLFTPASRCRSIFFLLALLWTLGIFVACLWPGNELPKTDVPFADKWTHFVLFGVFAFLWLGAFPDVKMQGLLAVFAIGVALGWLVECLQGWLPQLGRSKDVQDMLADAVGAALGTFAFGIGRRWRSRRSGSW